VKFLVTAVRIRARLQVCRKNLGHAGLSKCPRPKANLSKTLSRGMNAPASSRSDPKNKRCRRSEIQMRLPCRRAGNRLRPKTAVVFVAISLQRNCIFLYASFGRRVHGPHGFCPLYRWLDSIFVRPSAGRISRTRSRFQRSFEVENSSLDKAGKREHNLFHRLRSA